MTTVTITAKGQVTLKPDLLKHLGVGPGERIEADKLPDGRIVVGAAAQDDSIADFIGSLSQRGGRKLTIDENERDHDPGMGQEKMKNTADLNVLIRAAVQDEPHQAREAAKVLQEGDLVAVPIPVLCEFVWACVEDTRSLFLRYRTQFINR